MQRKAAKLGFDWPDVGGALPKIAEEATELIDAIARGDRGRSTMSSATCCSPWSTSPATSRSSRRRRYARHAQVPRRFERVEQLAAERQISMNDANLAVLDELWDQVKKAE